MKINIYIPLCFTLLMILTLTIGCEKEEEKQEQLPVLTTSMASEITKSSAVCGGNVSSDGGSVVISRGVCWSSTKNPTIANSKTIDGTGTGAFSSSITGLLANTTYFVRAYATNNSGTAYGTEISFTTNMESNPQFNIFKIIDGKEICNIIKTNDGGYIGIAYSDDYNVMKFDSDFNVIWDKTYGGSKGDYVESIIQTNDGGYIVIGETKSSDGDVTLNHGDYDIWLCKLDVDGNMTWEKSYGGTNTESVSGENSIQQTIDGGYVFIGGTNSDDGDVSLNHGGHDVWLVKISSIGDIEYEKTYGGSNNDYGRKVISTNSIFTLLITSGSNNGDFNKSGNWVVQINQSWGIIWKTNVFALNSGSLINTTDGDFIVVNTSSQDFLLNRLGSDGTVKLTKTISFQSILPKQPSAEKILQTANNGFIIIGSVLLGDDADALLFKVNPDFNLIYSKIYSGSYWDVSCTLIPVTGNTYFYQFYTFSRDIPNVNYSCSEASVVVKVEE
ncbi:MAG TPA: hypothetical protein PKJ28_07990 [Bacteroidales bacterium]|nr:hypothetical protein [Bacteroidales bacterium]